MLLRDHRRLQRWSYSLNLDPGMPPLCRKHGRQPRQVLRHVLSGDGLCSSTPLAIDPKHGDARSPRTGDIAAQRVSDVQHVVGR